MNARNKHPDAYRSLLNGLHWKVPQHFNIAQVCATRWAQAPETSKNIAIIEDATTAAPRFYSYSDLQAAADALSLALARVGIGRGDCVGIVLPQRFETAVAYIAVLQMGAVAMPLSMLFGSDALAFRLQDGQAKALICDELALPAVASVRRDCPQLRHVMAMPMALAQAGDAAAGRGASVRAPTAPNRANTRVNTRADDPAVLIYTSGTTGNPKGALIPHRALIGNLSGFVCSQNWFGFDPFDAAQPSTAVFWSPADWAWTGGLMDALLPTLYFGRPIVASRQRFSAELAFGIFERHRISHTFLFPTALKAMMKAYPQPRAQFDFALQAIMSAGEAVGDAVYAYCRDALGVVVNEMFGQTEVNYIVGNCARLVPTKPGSMGKGYPGHRVAVIDEQGRECAPGVVGEVAVHRLDVHGHPDPVFFLGYWNNEAATRAKFTRPDGRQDDWCRTGDLATSDADGYLWYQGRADDVFKAAGYRIGPSEIENCLVKHADVANAAVVPKPDAARGALVKAYVVLAPDAQARRAGLSEAQRHQLDEQLIEQLQQHVRERVAPYEVPKEIEFIDALPMTTTGKVQRRVLRLQEEARAAARAP